MIEYRVYIAVVCLVKRMLRKQVVDMGWMPRRSTAFFV